jgi:TonB family protein
MAIVDSKRRRRSLVLMSCLPWLGSLAIHAALLGLLGLMPARTAADVRASAARARSSPRPEAIAIRLLPRDFEDQLEVDPAPAAAAAATSDPVASPALWVDAGQVEETPDPASSAAPDGASEAPPASGAAAGLANASAALASAPPDPLPADVEPAPDGGASEAEGAPAEAAAASDAGVDAQAIDPQGLRPKYPWRCKLQGHQGVAIVEIEVEAGGRAGGVRLVQSAGCAALDAAAVDAARRARFVPATRNGRPIASSIRLPFRFQLRDAREASPEAGPAGSRR